MPDFGYANPPAADAQMGAAGATAGAVLVTLDAKDAQDSVISQTNSPPGSPAMNARYIVTSVATGAWTGQETKIAQWNGKQWKFTTPTEGAWLRDETLNAYYTYSGSAWATLTSVMGAATESLAGVAELATQAETNTGTDDARIVTPAKMVNYAGPLNSLTSIAPSILTGGNAANTADNAVLPALHVVYPVKVTGGANADHDVTITHKTRVTGVKVIKKSAAGTGSTITVKNGANAITDAIATVGLDNTTYLAATIDDAQYEIAAAGTLRVSSASGAADAPNCLVLVEGYRVA